MFARPVSSALSARWYVTRRGGLEMNQSVAIVTGARPANTVDSLGFGTGWCGEPLDEAQRRIALDPAHVVFDGCVSQTLRHTGLLIDA